MALGHGERFQKARVWEGRCASVADALSRGERWAGEMGEVGGWRSLFAGDD